MAEKEDLKKLLWMFRHNPPESELGEVDFDPVDEIYQLQKNTRNPYLKRAIAPDTQKLERSEADMERLSSLFSSDGEYQFGPSNINEPYLKRSLEHSPPPPHPRPQFQEREKLQGDSYKLPWGINEFFQSILSQLTSDPGNFDHVVSDLLQLFKDNKVKIKLYEAYYNFENWDHLMETLEEISHYPSAETFDLFCSALFTYYELVYPPEGA